MLAALVSSWSAAAAHVPGLSVGIDLGTTNSAIAILRAGTPEVVPNAHGALTTPSAVAFLGDGSVLVGEDAIVQSAANVHNTVHSAKRFIGRGYERVADYARAVGVGVAREEEEGGVVFRLPALPDPVAPEEVSAAVLRALLDDAERATGVRAERAVITVPAYFDDSQRLATETACLLSGLQEVKLLREPEAAALTYALDQQADSRVMVFDLGGGTFDVSILDVGSGVVEVIASAGDPRLGGDDWDHTIAQWLEDAFVQEHGVPVDGFGRRRLLDAAEEAKLHLSTHATTTVDVPFLAGDKGLTVTLSRRKFEALCRPLLLRLVPAMREAAGMAGLELDESNWGTLTRGDLDQAPQGVQQWQKTVAWRWRRMARRAGSTTAASFPLGDVPISKVLLVGGATRMPCIGRFIKRVTGLTALPDTRVNPDESVALGAAVMAGVLDGTVKQTVLRNPYQHSRAASKLADDILKPRDVYDI